MSRRRTQAPTLDQWGAEEHPAFALASVHRVSHSPPGAVLFDSEVRHAHYVTLTVKAATRKRDLSRDWIHEKGGLPMLELAMSEAQWAALVSSVNTSGVPVTVTATAEDPQVPDLPLEPRLALSRKEAVDSASRAYDAIKAAFEAVKERPTKANIRSLEIVLQNADKNVDYATERLAEHTEDVVTKARADIEAMVASAYQTHGLEAPAVAPLALEEAPDA